MSPSEFIIPYDEYMESVKNNYSIGMRFRMRFEGEEALELLAFCNLYLHVTCSLMDGAFRFGNAQEALSLYQEMIRLGLCPHKFTYNIIVRGFCDRGKMQDWLVNAELLGEATRGMVISAVYNMVPSVMKKNDLLKKLVHKAMDVDPEFRALAAMCQFSALLLDTNCS